MKNDVFCFSDDVCVDARRRRSSRCSANDSESIVNRAMKNAYEKAYETSNMIFNSLDKHR